MGAGRPVCAYVLVWSGLWSGLVWSDCGLCLCCGRWEIDDRTFQAEVRESNQSCSLNMNDFLYANEHETSNVISIVCLSGCAARPIETGCVLCVLLHMEDLSIIAGLWSASETR